MRGSVAPRVRSGIQFRVIEEDEGRRGEIEGKSGQVVYDPAVTVGCGESRTVGALCPWEWIFPFTFYFVER
jgi:hypothetical protein